MNMIAEIEIKIVPDENGNPVIHRVRTIRKFSIKRV